MNIKKPLVLNLLSGPGGLKSGLASGVFSLLKLHYMDCELVTEYPKELTWEENWKVLSMQGSIFGEQNRRLLRIGNKVDVIVTDTSLLYSLIYERAFLTKEFEDYIISVYNSYNNLNIFLTRNGASKYENFGRKQSEIEAMEIDNLVKIILTEHRIKHYAFRPGLEAINNITSIILERFDKKIKYNLKEII
jgi:hypothetical protein